MKKKTIKWTALLFILLAPILFIYMTFTNSVDCNQLVIDTYEMHSGINIPDVEFVNCYYDEVANTRISVYELNAQMDLSKFERSNTANLKGISLLEETEHPNSTELYLASGEKWGTQWTYVVDEEAGRLWAELRYD